MTCRLHTLCFHDNTCVTGAMNVQVYSALQDSCSLERVNRQWLNSVMVHNTKAISLYSDIDSCSFTTPARQLTCKALYECTRVS